MNFALLMTACIQVQQDTVHATFRSDTATRLNDYITAFKYWLSYDEEKMTTIIFVDNSGYDLTILKEIAENGNIYNRTIEFLQFEPNTRPRGLHYGYSELEIMDMAFKLSKAIEHTQFVIKVTGRLYFPKLRKLIKRVQPKNKIIIDFKDYRFFKIQKHYAITTLVIIQNDFYRQYLFDLKKDMVKDYTDHFETLYFNKLKALAINDKNIITRFPFNVDPVGVGGYFNANYSSFSKSVESFIRGLFRIVLPKFHI
jgi:hypothetical protein